VFVAAYPTGARGVTRMMQVRRLARKALDVLTPGVGVKLFITLLRSELHFDIREGGMRK
jgi:hypothetical protein